MNQNPNEFTFFEHLNELRNRAFKCAVVILICAFAFYQYVDLFLSYMIKPLGRVVYNAPADAFMAKMNLTVFGAVFLAAPFILYQIWQFVALGFKGQERRWVMFFGPLSLVFFVIGVLFGYCIALPMSLNFLLGFSTAQIVPMVTIDRYISYVGGIVLAFGVVFELPLILMFLTKIGIATPAFLIQKRRHAIVLLFIISAIFTPPEVITQLLMAGPLIILYELGVVFSKLSYRD